MATTQKVFMLWIDWTTSILREWKKLSTQIFPNLAKNFTLSLLFVEISNKNNEPEVNTVICK